MFSMTERRHVEHCFTFKIPRRKKTPFVLREVWSPQYDQTLVITAVHTGCTLPPSANEFRLIAGAKVWANVTFDTFAAFFPRRWDRDTEGLKELVARGVLDPKILSYVLAKPTVLASKGSAVGELELQTLKGLPEEITITCGGLLTRDII